MRSAHRIRIAHQRQACFRLPVRSYASTGYLLAAKAVSSNARPAPSARPPASPKSRSQEKEKQDDPRQSQNGQKQRFARWKQFKTWFTASQFRMTVFGGVFAFPIIGCIQHATPLYYMRVTGPSMAPTINADCTSGHDIGYTKAGVLVESHVGIGSLTSRAARGAQVVGKYMRGDIVIYKVPHDPESFAVKRVVGVPGDVVTPLEGGDQEGVVVPYNHIWVEGDAGDRRKTRDSNSFGPLSQELVAGRVIAIMHEWWNPFSWTSAATASKTWPALEQDRVNENAVQEAANNPDHVAKFQEIEGDAGKDVLLMLRRQGDKLKYRFRNNYEYSVQVKEFWTYSKAAARGHHDPASKAQAQEIVDQLEAVFGGDAIRQVTTRWKKGKRARGSLEQLDIDSDLDAALDKHLPVDENGALTATQK